MSRVVKSATRPLLALLLAAGLVYGIKEMAFPKRLRAATTWYAAPGSGSGCSASVGWASGTGAIGCPWTLGVALAGGPGGTTVQAGDTVYLRAGTYSGFFTATASGTAAQPIVFRNYQDGTSRGEHAILDGGTDTGVHDVLGLSCSYCTFWGLDITSSATDGECTSGGPFCPGADVPYGQGIATKQTGVAQPGQKIINNVVHDTRQGLSSWKESIGMIARGNIFYYNGWNSLIDGNHGHGMYLQNQTSLAAGSLNPANLRKVYSNNISFFNADEGCQLYGGQPNLLHLSDFQNNFFFRNGSIPGSTVGDGRNMLMGAGDGSGRNTVSNSVYYYTAGGPSSAFKLDTQNDSAGTTISSNYFYNSSLFTGTMTNLTVSSNTFRGITGFTCNQYGANTCLGSDPVVSESFVRANADETGRCNVLILNWASNSSLNVDLTPCGLTNGGNYEIYRAAEYWGTAAQSGTWNSGAPNVSFTLTGYTYPDPTRTQFTAPSVSAERAFVVIPAPGAAATATPTNTQTFTQTNTPSNTNTPSQTFTASATPTFTATGVVSTNTPSPTFTPVPGGCTYIEAEAGTLVAPMGTASDTNALGGQYITSNTANSGTVTFSFAPGAGTYYLNQRVMAVDGNSDSTFTSYDGQADTTHINDHAEQLWGSSWQWTRVTDRSIGGCSPPLSGNPAACQRSITIADGNTHTFAFRMREANGKIDNFALCPNSNVPGDPPATATPTPTNTFTPTPPPTDTPGGPTATNTNTATKTFTPTFTFTPSPSRTPDPGIGPPHTHFCKGRKYRHSHPPSYLQPHTHPCPF